MLARNTPSMRGPQEILVTLNHSAGLAPPRLSGYIVKPLVTTADGSKRVYWGDTVVATAGGARRMGVRPREIVEVR